MTNNNAVSSLPLSLLGILFIGLKLTGYITWSWLWVLAPFWVPLVVVLGILAIVLVIACLRAALKK